MSLNLKLTNLLLYECTFETWKYSERKQSFGYSLFEVQELKKYIFHAI